MRYNTSDNDKKPKDNQAEREEKIYLKKRIAKLESSNTPRKQIISKSSMNKKLANGYIKQCTVRFCIFHYNKRR